MVMCLLFQEYIKNNNLTRNELKKFMKCKVLMDKSLRCTTFYGTNGSGIVISQKYGKFTSDNVTLRETAINNKILRIPLLRNNLEDLKRKLLKNYSRRMSSFGRQIKKKNFYGFEVLDYSSPESSSDSLVINKVKQNKDYSFVDVVKTKKENQRDVTPSIHRRIQQKSAEKYPDKGKTLNRTIKKDGKMKLFPQKSVPTRNRQNNGGIRTEMLEESCKLHREILFVKQYRNEHLWSKLERRYYLKFPHHRYPIEGKLNYDFQKLVTDVKVMKLPNSTWKIKVIIRQGKISAITFTNKLELERNVSFSSNTDKYNIIIDNRPALLLGSPGVVNCANDIEILLDIIQNIDPESPMILYK